MDFSRKGVEKIQSELVSKSPRAKRKIAVSCFKAILVFILVIAVTLAGLGFGTLKGILDETPDVNADSLIPTGYKTTLVYSDGVELATLSNFDSNREYVYYNTIPANLVNAFVAIEDERFWTHNGIDVQGIARAFVLGVKNRDFSQGASTLTQQLIKNNIYDVGLNETTFIDKLERKIQEQFLAIEMEKQLSKESIVEYYLNTIYLGEGCSGVQTAAEYYFNKELDELTISECAVLAAIPQNPSQYDPTVYPESNAQRRLDVLDKMLKQEYITQAQYDEAIADGVYKRIKNLDNEREAAPVEVSTYYTDAVIDQLLEDFMEQGKTEDEAYYLIYKGGLKVVVAQDREIQDICDEVLTNPDNFSYPKYQLEYALTLQNPETLEQTNYSREQLVSWYKEQTGNSNYKPIYSSPDEARAAADKYKEAMIEATGNIELLESFNTIIQPQISFSVIDQKTGQVKALVGGREAKFTNRAFNRATMAKRQPGSTFKVLASFLPALDGGGKGLGTSYIDAPFNYENGKPCYNWYGGYRGPSSIRDAIRDSMNIIAVKTITDITPQLGYDYLLKLGFTTLVERRTADSGLIESDINQSLALGGITDGVTNIEMTAAYATIANKGKHIKPIFYTEVLDHDGNLLIDNKNPEGEQVITEQTSWLLIDAMRDVVTGGTGTAANSQLGMYTVGKTGTTSSNYDAWFCGFNPYYTASIWIGYDLNTSYDPGSLKMRLWRQVMDGITEAKNLDTSATFERPDGIVTCTVCADTGLIPTSACSEYVTDYFAATNVPTEYCKGITRVTLCDESHMKATSKCPNTTSYVVETDDYGRQVVVGADGFTCDIENECDLHPEEDEDDTEEDEKDKKNKFSISTSVNGDGGSISPSTSLKKGKSYTVYITPNNGYSIAAVYVDGTNVGPVSSYNFSNVNEDHTISVTFAENASSTEDTTEATTESTTEAPVSTEDTTETPTEPPTDPPEDPGNEEDGE